MLSDNIKPKNIWSNPGDIYHNLLPKVTDLQTGNYGCFSKRFISIFQQGSK